MDFSVCIFLDLFEILPLHVNKAPVVHDFFCFLNFTLYIYKNTFFISLMAFFLH